MHGGCFPWNSVRTHGRNWAGVSLIEASNPGTGPRFHILSPWIFQNHSPLHLMSVTNSPGTFLGETLCDRIARFIFRLDRGNLLHHPWLKNPMDDPWCWAWRGGPRKCWSFIYQWTLEFEFQSPWYRLHWGREGRIVFFVFFAVTAPPYLERKMNHCNQLVPAHTCIVSKRESLVFGGVQVS